MREAVAERVEGSALAVELPAFSGPLDLLLHLIQKNRVSICDIPIALICGQYHSHLTAMEELDLEIAAEFLWMASWLLELKSKSLLPWREEGEEDPRQELVERLLEYRRCRELAALLHERDVVRRCLWQPALALELDPGDAELDWEEVDLGLLARAYLEAMQRFQTTHPPPLQVEPLRFKVEDTMRELYLRVTEDSLVPLLRHLHSKVEVDEVVVLVVAALELVRLGGVSADQRLPFAEIYLRPGRVLLDPDHLLRLEAGGGA